MSSMASARFVSVPRNLRFNDAGCECPPEFESVFAQSKSFASDLRHVTKGPKSQIPTLFSSRMNGSGGHSFVLRLDYLSCILTIASTVLVGRRRWEGWALAAANSVLMCVIGVRTEQSGFIPANVFCMVVSAVNLRAWRRSKAA